MPIVNTNTVKNIRKEAFVAGGEIAAAIAAFVNAPEGTEVLAEERVIDGKTVEGYSLAWDHTPAKRSPRKPKVEAQG